MPAKLIVKHRSEGKEAAGAEHMLDDAVITLGRDKSCQIPLEEKAVSRTHARISRDGALFFVEDLGSSYGTLINGKKLPKGEKRLLRNGDVIAIAQYDISFDRVADAIPPSASGEKTSYVARQVVKDAMKGLRSESPFLRYMNGPNEGQRIEIGDAQEIVIGRDQTMADIVFKDDLVSRRHVKIRRDWSGTHIEDLGSRNGIKVNKKKTTRKTLRDKDEVQIGNTRLLYLDANEVREEAPQLEDFVGDEGEGGPTAPPPDMEPISAPKSEAAKKAAPPAAAAAEESQPEAPPSEESSPPQSDDDARPEGEEPSQSESSQSGGEEEDSALRQTRAQEADLDDAAAEDDGADQGEMSLMSDPRKRYALIGVMGITGFLALLLLILVLVGA